MPTSQQQLNFAIRATNEATAQLRAVKAELDNATAGAKQTDTGLKQLQATTVAVGVAMFEVFKRLGEEAYRAAKEIVVGYAEAGAQIEVFHQRTGLSSQSLSELSYAAKLTGADISDLATGMRFLDRNLVQAAQGQQAAIDKFNLLGLSVSEFQGLNPDQIFDKVARAVSSIEDPTARSALAVGLFGRGAQALIPLLSEGAAGLDEMRKQAQDLGITFNEQTAAEAKKVEDQFIALQGKATGLGYTLGKDVLPIVSQVADILLTLSTNTDIVTAAIVGVGGAIALALVPITGPLGLVVGLGLVSGALLLMRGHWDEVFAALPADMHTDETYTKLMILNNAVTLLANTVIAFINLGEDVWNVGRGLGAAAVAAQALLSGNFDKLPSALAALRGDVPGFYAAKVPYLDMQSLTPNADVVNGARISDREAAARAAAAVVRGRLLPGGNGGGFDPGAFDAGGAAAKAATDGWTKAMESIQAHFLDDQVQAYMDGGQQAVTAIRATQQKQIDDATSAALKMRDALGLGFDQMGALVNGAMASIVKAAEASAQAAASAADSMVQSVTRVLQLSGSSAFSVGFGASYGGNLQDMTPEQLQAAINAGNEATNARVQSYATGGTVGGPLGAPRLILAHGGEQVLTPQQQGGINVYVTMTGPVGDPVSFSDAIVGLINQAVRSGGQRLDAAAVP